MAGIPLHRVVDGVKKVYSVIICNTQCYKGNNIKLGTKDEGDISGKITGIFDEYLILTNDHEIRYTILYDNITSLVIL